MILVVIPKNKEMMIKRKQESRRSSYIGNHRDLFLGGEDDSSCRDNLYNRLKTF